MSDRPTDTEHRQQAAQHIRSARDYLERLDDRSRGEELTLAVLSAIETYLSHREGR